MSYILEALKKAQAERQLGHTPTIHAPQPAPAAPQPGAGRKPLLLGLGAGALVVIVAGAALLWRQAGPVAQPAAVAGAPAPAVATAPQPAPFTVATAPSLPGTSRAPAGGANVAAQTLEVSAPPAPPGTPAPFATARPEGHAAAPAAGHAPALAAAPAASPVQPPSAAAARNGRSANAPGADSAAPRANTAASAANAPASGANAAAAPVRPAAPASAADDSLPFLQQLPDTLQREVPKVAFGGYMYSANPADRLLLVDKALRHEGEEVAPGLVLEKLLPRAAVMNYRGVRYRVAY
ncbi:general secretion pathway protein GspB [Massilia forsythiae]|uniref:General secretion pathway protein GspB n=1 Tax=Massilia forsythiae TaxID=2728020 RepID=A0A7Z2ZQX5_9BURK|nr:general secretion pathway protein GspB [Massilia forsythiae]QJD98872.1 general secretion pathway protein GspB [Massilia forsythiae]